MHLARAQKDPGHSKLMVNMLLRSDTMVMVMYLITMTINHNMECVLGNLFTVKFECPVSFWTVVKCPTDLGFSSMDNTASPKSFVTADE